MSKSAKVIQLEGATLRQQLLTPIATISDHVSEISLSLIAILLMIYLRY